MYEGVSYIKVSCREVKGDSSATRCHLEINNYHPRRSGPRWRLNQMPPRLPPQTPPSSGATLDS